MTPVPSAPVPPRFVAEYDGDLYRPLAPAPAPTRSPTPSPTPWFAPTPASPVPALDQTFVFRQAQPAMPEVAKGRGGRDTLYSAEWFEPGSAKAPAMPLQPAVNHTPSIALLVASGLAGGVVATGLLTVGTTAVLAWLWWA